MSFPLRLNSNERPLLGRFSNPILLETANKPILMYEEPIEIIEEEAEEDIEKTAEYWAAKRKKKKNRYMKKTKFHIEDDVTYDKQHHSVQNPFSINDDTANGKVRFEGVLTKNNTVDAKNDVDLYKYVIMQVVNNPMVTTNSIVNESNETVTTVSTTMQSEVSITPVGEWVEFRYPSVASSDVFLGQIDDDYESQERARKQANARYKAISTTLANAKDKEEVSASFGVASSKKSYNRKKLIASLESHGEEDENDGGGVSVHAGVKAHRAVKEEDSEFGQVHAGEMGGDGAEGEQGVDFDEVFDDDDEVMGGVEEQEEAERDEASSKTKRGLYQAVDSEDEDGSASEDEEEEEAKEEKGTGNRQAEMVAASARELKWHLKQQQVQQQRVRPPTTGVSRPNLAAIATAIPASTSTETKTNAVDLHPHPTKAPTGMKRPRDESGSQAGESNSDGNIKKRKTTQPESESEPGKSPVTVTTATATSTSVPSTVASVPFHGDKFELNDAGMKAQIKYAGGKISAKDLAQAFKRQIKFQRDAGKQKFKSIASRVTETQNDAIMGKVLVIAQK